MFDLLQMSGCCSIDASAATIAPTAALLLILSFASPSMLNNSRVLRSFALSAALVLVAFLCANSAHAVEPNSAPLGTPFEYDDGAGLRIWLKLRSGSASCGNTPPPPAPWQYAYNVYAPPSDAPCDTHSLYKRSFCAAGYVLQQVSPWQCVQATPEPELNCGPGTPNPNNTCTCNDDAYKRLDANGLQTCFRCPRAGFLMNEQPIYFSGQGPVPDKICVEFEGNVGGSGCWRETSRSIRQGTSYAATALSWTGTSCTVGTDHPNTGEPDASPDNPNSPDDCLAAGKGYIQTNGQTQCVANGTGQNPVTTTNTRTATNSDGTRTTTTTVTNNYGNTTNTTTTSVTTRPDGQTSSDSTSSTGGPDGDVSGDAGKCGAPGQPACRVTLAGGQGEGDAANLNLPSPTAAFNGEAETGLLGGPLNSFLSTARTKLEEAVLLPDLAAGDCSALTLWDGFVLDVCAQVELAREIVAWIFYASALWFGWAQLQRAIDRGAS